MKFVCLNCEKEIFCVAQKNPPPCPLQKKGEFICKQEMLVMRQIHCDCGASIGEEVFSCNNPGQLGWWFINQNLFVKGDQGFDWKQAVKTASSSFVLRIASLVNRLQQLEANALQVNEILNEIKRDVCS